MTLPTGLTQPIWPTALTFQRSHMLLLLAAALGSLAPRAAAHSTSPSFVACYLTCKGKCTTDILDPTLTQQALCIDNQGCSSGINQGLDLMSIDCLMQDQPSSRSVSDALAVVTCNGLSTCLSITGITVSCYSCSGPGCEDPFLTANQPQCTGSECFVYTVNYPSGRSVTERGCSTVAAVTGGPVSKNLTTVGLPATVTVTTCLKNLCNAAALPPSPGWWGPWASAVLAGGLALLASPRSTAA